jgi:pimeloyl-ACP methyl ester carboxylesterase
MPAYLLIPKILKTRVLAIICFYGGAGKATTVGLSGPRVGTPPAKNSAFAIDMVEAGFVAFAADYLRDGERIKPGRRPYDTSDFYNQFPDWSIHGKDAWDTMRAIDYLQTLDFIDPHNIGMVGHSYGGHSTLFTAALEPRIKAAWANGPVSDFLRHGLHWAVPKGAGNSQSLPAMRPHVLDRTLEPPVTFYEFTALIAPRPLVVAQRRRRLLQEVACTFACPQHSSLTAIHSHAHSSRSLSHVRSPRSGPDHRPRAHLLPLCRASRHARPRHQSLRPRRLEHRAPLR